MVAELYVITQFYSSNISQLRSTSGKHQRCNPVNVAKVRVTQWHSYAGTQGRRRNCNIPFATSVLVGGGSSALQSSRITPAKEPVSVVQEAVWASGPVWTARKNSPPPGSDPRTVQHIASHYIDWAIPATTQCNKTKDFKFSFPIIKSKLRNKKCVWNIVFA